MGEKNRKLMLDTNTFDRFRDGTITVENYRDRILLITPIQESEIEKMKSSRNEATRQLHAELMRLFKELSPISVLPVFALGIEGAGVGQGVWHDGKKSIHEMFSFLKQLDSENKIEHRNKSVESIDKNQWADVLIAEAAIRNNACLLTFDRNLKQVFDEFRRLS